MNSADEDRERLYEWQNYRWAAGSINSSKKALRAHQLIDPFEVGDDWFEVLLPSLELVMTDRCPPEHHERARTMLDRLGLRRERQVLSTRQAWYQQFLEGEINLGGLDRNAPLLSLAVRRRLTRMEVGSTDEQELMRRLLEGSMSLGEPRRLATSLARRVEETLRAPPDASLPTWGARH